jgi:hypothetical protein
MNKQERWWAGYVHVRADKIHRPIPEGTEIELTIKLDQPRKMNVEVFIRTLERLLARLSLPSCRNAV